MPERKYSLIARVRSEFPYAVRKVIDKISQDVVRTSDNEFLFRAHMKGENAEKLNSSLFSEILEKDRNATLHAEWSLGNIKEIFNNFLKEGKLLQ